MGGGAGSKPSKDKMRSSKSRSRSKQNRPRTLGNIINRVFDSSGPEGKVRGTPQQIIEKYQMLARDAQLSNDRVAAENFLQHAEHYTRLLAEAQREMAAEQEARQQYQQQNQNGHQNGNRDRPQGDRDSRDAQPRQDRGDYRSDYRSEQPAEPEFGAAPDAFDVVGGEDEAGLVDLPESSRAEAPRAQQPRREDYRRDDNRPAREPQAQQPRREDNRRRDEVRPPQEQQRRREAPAIPRAEVQTIEIAVKAEAPAPEAAPSDAPPPKAAPRPRVRRPAAPKADPVPVTADKPEAAE